MPRVSATIRSRTSSSSRPGTTVASKARASVSPSPSSTSSGRPINSRSSLGSRTAKTIATDSASSRRRDESKHLRRGAVEPLRVIDDTEQLLLLGDFRKQAERGQGDEEPIGGRAGRQAERGAQCVALRCRETTEPGEHRGAQLMQSRERQLHLRLDGHAPGNAKTRRLADAVAQKRGLAHTRLATNDEHCALALADVLEQPVQRSPLAGPTPELRRTVRGHSRDQATSRRCVPQTSSADQGLSLARRAARSATLTPPAAKRLEANREQH